MNSAALKAQLKEKQLEKSNQDALAAYAEKYHALEIKDQEELKTNNRAFASQIDALRSEFAKTLEESDRKHREEIAAHMGGALNTKFSGELFQHMKFDLKLIIIISGTSLSFLAKVWVQSVSTAAQPHLELNSQVYQSFDFA